MRKLIQKLSLALLSLFFFTLSSCDQNNKTPSNEIIKSINLKRGELVVCGSSDKQFGAVAFATSCSEKT